MSAIVVGVDGSHDSDAAVSVAKRLGRGIGAELVLVSVVEQIPAPYAGLSIGMGAPPRVLEAGMPEQAAAAAAAVLDDVASAAGLEGAEQRVIVGHAAERLAEVADEVGAAYVVVGSRGRGAFKAALLGSVSTSLIGIAPCPVVVVPRGVPKTAAEAKS